MCLLHIRYHDSEHKIVEHEDNDRLQVYSAFTGRITSPACAPALKGA